MKMRRRELHKRALLQNVLFSFFRDERIPGYSRERASLSFWAFLRASSMWLIRNQIRLAHFWSLGVAVFARVASAAFAAATAA
jgi:hypothetical protein